MGSKPQTDQHVDRRVRRSKRAILEAFDRLVIRMPIDKMTVSELAREADVDRKTLYQHFGGIDGVIDALADDLVTHVLDEVEAGLAPARARIAVAGEGATLGPQDAAHGIMLFFDALTKNLSEGLVRERTYLEHVPSDVLFNHLRHPFERQVAERGLLVGIVPDRLIAPSLSYTLGGVFSLYHGWLTQPWDVELDEVTELASRLATEGLVGMMRAAGPDAGAEYPRNK